MLKDIINKNESVIPNGDKLALLKENFPSCFRADGTFDLANFSDFLKDKINVTKEGYGLNFLGKDYAKMLASLDTATIIQPDLAHSSKAENKDSENIYISMLEGNLICEASKQPELHAQKHFLNN